MTEGRQPARRWWILAVICVAQLLDVIDLTIVNIALPHAQSDLGFSAGDRQWIVTAYALAFGALLLPFGRLSDLIGRRGMLMTGLIIFAGASALGGSAPSFAVLVAARGAQGVAAAMIAPAALALLSTTFTEPKERSTAFAVFGGISGSGAALGMLLGGMLTNYLSWRSTLFVNVAIGLVALLGAATLITRPPKVLDRPNLDVPGTLIASAGLCVIVYGFAGAESHPWSAPNTWAVLAGGVLLIAIFMWWQTRARHPLLPPEVIRDRTRGGANLAIFIGSIGLFGTFLFLNYYLQETLHYSPIATGLAFLPMVVAVAVTGGVCTTQLYPRFGARPPIVIGMLSAAAAMLWLTRIGTQSTYTAGILGPLMALGMGIGAIMAPAMIAGTTCVEPRDAGIASATVNVAQQLGGAIGLAFLNSIAAATLTRYAAGHDGTSPAVHTEAAIHSYTIAFWSSGTILATGAIACGLVMRSGSPPHMQIPTTMIHRS
ncbi:MFS transporter [Mycolicibacterium pallens]|uniref:MFS transporter n=1 Tax=Mycolicibacterium pallens TaxID=370524 RepID=A0ABX8VWS4_9MYCO|nr:MFS transporter [Mycolicibacterium pallens]QYL20226.1 MFS transporter [Mycolicibacterium pallens]